MLTLLFMSTTTVKLRWPFWAGLAMAGAGLGLAAMIVLKPGEPPLLWSGLVMAASAILELTGGLALFRRGGAGISHTIIGGVAIALGLTLFAVGFTYPGAFQAQTSTMLLGVFFLSTAIACAIDLFVDRPQALLAQALEVGVSFGLAVLALWGWRMATPTAVATLIALDLLFSGLALAATSAALRSHPEDTPYHGYQERLQHASQRLRADAST
ncbi:MAG: hypothetical protein Q8N23_18540 [Archangium sp.]|nr:hypothetical protein [Archangium sp.]MDP3154684.1 hypothetical protein [Archangium sp.]MDP3572688.1 hypothetical protein [Archangium sp.]